jgi:translation elongation factor P/translation initiation factor 5A
MILNNDSNSKKVEYGIFKLLHQLTNTLRCDTVKMDKQLQQFIQKSGSDYVLMLVVRGYTRTKADKNYKIAQAVLTLGTQVAESFKGSTTIYLAIADKRTNQIVYYDRLENKDSDPLRRPDMEGQLNSIITKLYN